MPLTISLGPAVLPTTGVRLRRASTSRPSKPGRVPIPAVVIIAFVDSPHVIQRTIVTQNKASLFLIGLAKTAFSGCYWPVSLQNSFSYASYSCNTHSGAFLAKDESANKARYLASKMPGASFYIGLTFDKIDRAWKWMDGSPLGDYRPWIQGTPTNGQAPYTSVTVNPDGLWVPTDPRSPYFYSICQKVPCSTSNYCW